MVGVIFVYVDTVFGFYGYSLLLLVGCFSMTIWTPAVLSILYACALYFCICTCSAQLSMFHLEKRSKNMLITIIIIIIAVIIIIIIIMHSQLYLLGLAFWVRFLHMWPFFFLSDR